MPSRRSVLAAALALPALLTGGALTLGASARPAAAAPTVKDKAAPPEAYPERILGNPDAPVTIFEYSSLTCPHCADFHTQILPDLKAQFIDTGKARLVMRDFPLDRVAAAAALMARKAPEPMFFKLIEVLFTQQRQWSSADNPAEALKKIGRLAGMDGDTLDAALADEALFNAMRETQERAQAIYGINSTPTFIVGETKLVGARPLSEFAAAIEAAAKAAR